jgi:hypothetical protein
MTKRLRSILQAVHDPTVQANAFLADCLLAAIRAGAIHLIYVDEERAPDSLDCLAALKRQANPKARVV